MKNASSSYTKDKSFFPQTAQAHGSLLGQQGLSSAPCCPVPTVTHHAVSCLSACTNHPAVP